MLQENVSIEVVPEWLSLSQLPISRGIEVAEKEGEEEIVTAGESALVTVAYGLGLQLPEPKGHGRS